MTTIPHLVSKRIQGNMYGVLGFFIYVCSSLGVEDFDSGFLFSGYYYHLKNVQFESLISLIPAFSQQSDGAEVG